MLPDRERRAGARGIREHERSRSIVSVPILAVTANASTEDMRCCLAAGMHGFLEMPIRRQQLESAHATVCKPKAVPTAP